MLGSTVLPSGSRVAVYWETYGIGVTDTVDAAVLVERYSTQGLMRRLGGLLGIKADLNTPIVHTWRENDASRAIRVPTRTQTTILARSIVIDFSALPAGNYWLEVAASTRGREPVRSRISITIR